jgi:hypothetical protein
MSSPQLGSREEEILSLNAGDLDVQELERRLDLANGLPGAGAVDGSCYIDGCDENWEALSDASA